MVGSYQFTVLLLFAFHVQFNVCEIETSVCSITYQSKGEITADCSGRSLTSVPASLPNGLTHLMVNQNSISDVTAVGRYRRLRMLEASHNLLVKMDWQFLPDSLQELHLSHNNITNLCGGSGLPSTRGFLPSQSVFPPKLRVLVLSHNKITALDQDCFKFVNKSLRVINLSWNSIQTVDNNTFHGLSNLTYLDLSYNQITALQPGALSGLWSLERLDLNNNELEDSPTALPPGVFHDVSATLTTLRLHSNFMGSGGEYPDEALRDLTSLEKLSMDAFPYFDDSSYFREGFSCLRNLTELALDQDYNLDRKRGLNQLSNNTFAAFANTSLQSLSMTNLGFPLVRVEACAFCPLRNLTYLNLDYMNTVLPTLDDLMASFQAFTLTNEFLSIRAPGFLAGISKGTGVHLTAKAMRFVHKMCLRELVLSLNFIVALESYALGKNGTRFAECVQRIDLSDNILIYVHSNIFFSIISFPQLRSLEFQLQRKFNLERAMIMFSLRQDTFESDKFQFNLTSAVPPALEFLNATGSSFLFGHSPSLVRFLGADRLITADVSFNRITNCAPILGLENLQNLNLSGSNCHCISLQTFDHYPKLKTLTLQRMNFSPLFLAHNGTRLFSKLKILETLDLSFNEIAILSPDILLQQMSLRRLILLGNYLENIKLDLSGLVNLTFLDMSNNRLSTLSQSERNMLDKLVIGQQEPLRLHLQGNPLLCTCSTLDFVRWLGDTRVVLDREGDYPCLTDSGQLSSTRTVGREWLHAWRGCVGPTVLWAAVAGMLVLLSLMGAVWGLAKNITRLRFLYTVIRRIKMPKRADFHRDAYVAYCDADTDFVCGRLKRQLQDRRGVRLLIKDLPVDAAGTRFYQLPGDNVALKMLEHIDLCWKVILVVTPALTRDSMVGFMTRAVLQSITDRMPHRVLLLCGGMREVPELASLKALLEAVPEHQVFFLPQPEDDYNLAWDGMAQTILN